MIWIQPKPWSRSCVSGYERYTMIIAAGGYKQAANSVDKNLKKFTRTLNHWQLPKQVRDSPKHEVVIAMKKVRIVQYLA